MFRKKDNFLRLLMLLIYWVNLIFYDIFIHIPVIFQKEQSIWTTFIKLFLKNNLGEETREISQWLSSLKTNKSMGMFVFACMYVCACPVSTEARMHLIPSNWSYSYKVPCGCWELNLGPLQEQQVMHCEPSLQPWLRALAVQSWGQELRSSTRVATWASHTCL